MNMDTMPVKIENGIIKSPFSPFEVPEVALHQALFSRYLEHGDKVAIVDASTGKEYTFRQLVDISRRVGSGLAKIGVKKGDVVSLFSYNTPEWLFMFYGTIYAGATVTTANHTYTKCTFNFLLLVR